MMLYGRSPRKMAPDLLPQYADVDLSVEFYKQSGSGEWEAIKRTTGDLLFMSFVSCKYYQSLCSGSTKLVVGTSMGQLCQ